MSEELTECPYSRAWVSAPALREQIPEDALHRCPRCREEVPVRWNADKRTYVIDRHKAAPSVEDVLMNEKLRERLAALEHAQWAHWTRHMLTQLISWGELDQTSLRLQDWYRQIQTPYAELTEKEKDSDREWADKVLALMSRISAEGQEVSDGQSV